MFAYPLSNHDDMREIAVDKGLNEVVKEFIDQSMRIAGYEKPEVGRSIKWSRRDFQLDR